MKIIRRLAYPALSLLFIFAMSSISSWSVAELAAFYCLGAIFVIQDTLKEGKL